MGKNQRMRKMKKDSTRIQETSQIKSRQKERFNAIAIPTTKLLLTILITIVLIFVARFIILKMEGEQGEEMANKNTGSSVVVIETDAGDITIELNPEAAPRTVENFKTLIDRGYYNGLTWHRVVEGFVIQGGDPKGDGTGGESAWGGKFEDEINPIALGLDEETIAANEQEGYEYNYDLPTSLRMEIGALAMANSGPNSNGSQFFIVTTQAQPHLDGRHTVFGMVREGMDVVNRVKQGEIIKRIYIQNNAS